MKLSYEMVNAPFNTVKEDIVCFRLGEVCFNDNWCSSREPRSIRLSMTTLMSVRETKQKTQRLRTPRRRCMQREQRRCALHISEHIQLAERRAQTISALSSFLLALLLYPDVQRRAQAEIDHVIGRSRLPAFSDRPRLPYVDAVCKELLRWRLVLPLGVAHATTEDGIYKGYFIPKGTTVLPNTWCVLTS